MQPVTLLCRSCGAPFRENISSSLRCSYCGTTTAIDATTHQRLLHHVARMRRAADKARCLLREYVLAQLLPAATFRAKVYLYGSLVVLFIVVPVMGLLGILLIISTAQADLKTAEILVPLGLVVLVLAGLIAVAAFPAGLIMAFREGKNVDVRAARGAREVEAVAEATAAVRCNQCGGHAQIVILGQRGACPCPWCGTALVAAQGDAAKVAADAILLAQQKTSEAALRRARVRAGLEPRSRFRLQIPGYALQGGVYESQQGMPVWVAFDVLEAGMHRRIEVEQATRLAGTVWFVRREVAQLQTQVFERYGVTAPSPVATDPQLDAAFAVLADPGVDALGLARLPIVQALLSSLGGQESVCFDPAGASGWRLGFSIAGGDHTEIPGRADALLRAAWELRPA